MKYILVEGIRRFLQIIFGMEIFNFPGLQSLRGLVYRACYKIGRKPVIENNVRFIRCHHQTQGGKLIIGNNVTIARGASIDITGTVIIEDNVTISAGAELHSHTHKIGRGICPKDNPPLLQTLVIKKGAWIGSHAVILPQIGVVGENAVVGSGSVVTKPVDDFTVVAGNPARIIKKVE
ncbi:MAG: acyltransferase [Acutalibacteraceae bacterium]